MEVGDRRWHRLIFCEELENNGEQNYVLCIVCEKSVLGCPAYKCLECNFHQHKSCTEPSHKVNNKIKHNLRERHHMMFIEELDNTGNEKVVCLGCEEAVFGPTYKCSIPKCTFHLHKSCIELSHKIQHPMHLEHTMFLQLPSSRNFCDVCRLYCDRSFFYRCFLCDFDIDVKCVSRWRISADDCNQHALFPMRKEMQFTCEACAKESKGIAYQCNICRVLIHGKCAQFPQYTIKIMTHDHSLTRTYSLRQVKKEGIVFCKLCYRKVNTEYAAYSCRKCDYIAHLRCAYRLEDKSSTSTIESEVSDSIGYESHLVHLVEGINLKEGERAGPQEIKHFSHPQHSLILNTEKFMDDMRCEACMQFIISVPFYGCSLCNFFVHNRCARLPTTIKRGIFHEHLLTLLSQEPSMGGLFECKACRRDHHGFRYKCNECDYYKLDIQCCLIPETLEHKGHQHIIFLSISRSYETCIACGRSTTNMNFVCTYCNEFALCIRCATLPLVAKCEYDTHILKLSYTREDDPEEYYCLICEEERDHPDHWFYYCVKCNFSSHVRCVLGENPNINYGRTFIDEDHEHPLTFVQKTKHSPPCDACGEPFHYDMALECTQCKFNVHHYWNCLSYISLKNKRLK